jgi:hypothetical protein
MGDAEFHHDRAADCVARSKKTKSDGDRRQLIEIAAVHLELADRLDVHWKVVRPGLDRLKIERWRFRAEECQTIAEALKNEVARASLLDAAERCRRMAEHAERMSGIKAVPEA